MTDGFTALAHRGFSTLLLWSWQALVLLTCAWLVLKLARFKSPARRYHIWLLSLVALALLPVASLIAQRLPSVRPANSTLNFAIEGPRQIVTLVSQRSAGTSIAPPLAKQPINALMLPVRSLVFGFWLLGVLILSTRLFKSQIELRRMLNRARPISPLELDLTSTDRRIHLRLSDEIDSPLLFGVFRPTIILPSDISEWTSSPEREAMVQHELAHIKRFDPLANLLQNALRIVFFFHPVVRYASSRLSLERELACDQLVLAGGIRAETYAEGLLKAAERSLLPSPVGQLAFFGNRQTFERRIEMIFRERAHAHTWKVVVLSAVTIAVFAWLLIPAGGSTSGQSQPSAQSRAKIRTVQKMAERKAFDELIDTALHNPDPEMRRLAAVQLTRLEGDGSTEAMVELYNKTDDIQVKANVIDTLARISEIEPLVKIAVSAQDPEEKQRALRRVKWLRQNSESNDVKNFDLSSLAVELDQVKAEPPPPPPPNLPVLTRRMPPPPPPRPHD